VVGAGLAPLACAPHSDSSRRNEKGAKLTKLSSNDHAIFVSLGCFVTLVIFRTVQRTRAVSGDQVRVQRGTTAVIEASPLISVPSNASNLSNAIPCWPFADRIVPTSRPSRVMGDPGGGTAPSICTGTNRRFTRPRYFVRAVSSWPM
jgi:hypothetical protein